MNRDIAAALATGVCIVALATPAQAQQRAFNIPAGSLKAALDAYGRQSGRAIIYRADDVRGVRSPGYRGSASPEIVLEALLSNTGFTARTDNSGAVAIVRIREAAASSGADAEEASSRDQVILVTGTSIRGNNPNSAALDVYTRRDLDNLGIVSVDQLLRMIPQNLNSTGSVGANSIGHAANQRNINAPDLRGLGPGATLSLLNGRRLPLANLGRGSDLSLIPLGAVERVEVLTDGASAIYGADAVGGVFNFILRDHYEGALTSISYGVRGDGGYSEFQFDQSGGVDWGSGGALASFTIRSAEPFRGQEVDFVASPVTTLSPADNRQSVFLSAHQNIGSRARIFIDMLYSDRMSQSTTQPTIQPGNTTTITNTYTEQLFGSAGFSVNLTDSLNFDLIATYGKLDDEASFSRYRNGVQLGTPRRSPQSFESAEITAKLDGKLFTLASEDVRFALGAGYLDQGLIFGGYDLGRGTRYAFGELNVPVIGAGRHIPLVQRLELNLSARYTSTSDFGDSFDPKVGIYWRLNDSLAARGTWAHSFRAPELLQLAPSESFIEILPVDWAGGSLPDPFTNDRSTVYLAVTDIGNPNLGPETSESFTLGLEFTPPSIRGLRVSATYYNIDYTNRIGFPPGLFEIAEDPETFGELIRIPDLATIQALVANSLGVFDYTDFSQYDADANALFGRATRLILNGITNIASQKTSGFDVAIDYNWTLRNARMRAGAKFTYMISNDEQTSPSLPSLRRLNTVSYPVDLRGRVYLGIDQGGWSGQLTLNYVDGYLNTAVEPAERIDSWTTLDLVAAYNFGAREGLLGGLRLGLTIRNIFNTDPPFVTATAFGSGNIANINYDAANHDPFGRMFMFNLTKEW
jgi:iron complex outermembrane receptor protein